MSEKLLPDAREKGLAKPVLPRGMPGHVPTVAALRRAFREMDARLDRSEQRIDALLERQARNRRQVAFPSLADVWGLFRKVDRLMLLEDKHGRLLADMQDQIDAMTLRMDRLESREEVVAAKVEGAARSAAMASATMAVADLARRLGALEERSRLAGGTGPPRLPS